jgi:hypothetical protein
MKNLFNKNFNFQILISYLGISPFIFIIIDLNIFNIFTISLLKEFVFFYLLLIFTFIGAMRWNFELKSNIYEVLFGFFPSLGATSLIIFFLFYYNINFILFIIIIFMSIQLLGDYFFLRYIDDQKLFFLKVRLPITLIIIFNIIYFISV